MRQIFVAITILIVLSACSQAPQPISYPLEYQNKMLAARHWDILATDVSERINLCLDGNIKEEQIVNKIVYVAPTKGVFLQAFQNMLINHLIQKRIQVVQSPTQDAITIETKAQLIRHSAEDFVHPSPGAGTLIAGIVRVIRDSDLRADWLIPSGIGADILFGSLSSRPQHEIVITTKILRNNSILLNSTDIYYIADRDAGNYKTLDRKINTGSSNENGGTRLYKVKG